MSEIKKEPVREPMNLSLPSDLMDIYDRVRGSGKELYVVGGAVRDALLGQTPKDYDLATDATPDQVIKILQSHGQLKLDLTGKSFGVVRVKTPDGNEYEIATFREDIGKGRRPEGVSFTSIEGDVKRRDLTVNALFYDINAGEVVDYVGGIRDVEDGVIRAVGDPADRFDEDKLRVLRAVRFAGRMGSELDDATAEAIKKDPYLEGVSADRISEEFKKGISQAMQVPHFLSILEELGLFEEVFPDLMINTDFEPTRDIPAQLALLLRDNDVNTVTPVLKGMRYTGEEIKLAKFLIKLMSISPDSAPALKKEFGKFPDSAQASIKELTTSEAMSDYTAKGFLEFAQQPLAADPQELMAQGLKGPAIGKAMEDAERVAYLDLVGEATLRSCIRQILVG